VAGVAGVKIPVLELMVYIEIVASSDAFDIRFATKANLPAGSTIICSDPKALAPVATVAGVVGDKSPVQEFTVYIETVLSPSSNT